MVIELREFNVMYTAIYFIVYHNYDATETFLNRFKYFISPLFL